MRLYAVRRGLVDGPWMLYLPQVLGLNTDRDWALVFYQCH